MDPKDDLLATIASYYYILNQSQSEIADRLDISTSKVSRLLKEARDRGIVDIRIKMPIPRDVHAEQQLIEHFGLRDAYVLQTSQDNSPDTRLKAIGQLASNYILRVLQTFPIGASVGVAWGTGVHAAVSALPDHAAQNIDVVQLLGGVGALVVDSPDLARIIARKLGGRHYDLPAPVLVEQPIVRDAFLSEPIVESGIIRAKSVHLAITGIGTVEDDGSSFLRAGLLSSSDLAILRNQGVVGEMCGRFFNINGHYTEFEINHRIIGIELEHLRTVPHTIAVANGLSKVKSIIGAMQGQYLKVLVTDDKTAYGILQTYSESIADKLSHTTP